jgi:hypothetical protein
MRTTLVLLAAAAIFVAPACEDGSVESSGTPTTCTPNASAPCDCILGGSGVKFCKEDGSGHGVCQRTQQAEAPEVPVECTPTDEYAYKGCFENDVFYFDDCGGKELFVSQCAEGTNCVDGGCISDCKAEYVTVCRDSEVVYQDSCGVDGEVVSVCGSGSVCKDGNCLEACIDASCEVGATAECTCSDGSAGTQTCTGNAWGTCVCVPVPVDDPDTTGCVPENTQAEQVCSGDGVIWLDDCGDPVGDATPCANGCTNGACDTSDECSPAHFKKGCHESDVWWFDYCDKPSEPIEGCGGYCEDAECVEACVPHAEKQCVNGDVFWFDSCGKQESVAEDCEPAEFCVNLSCVKGSYNGDWWIDPKFATPGFLSGKWTLSVDETTGVVTMVDTTAPAEFGGEVVYTGLLDGKALEATGTYSIPGVIDIDATIFLNFSAEGDSIGIPPPTHCDGTLQDTAITQVIGYKM